MKVKVYAMFPNALNIKHPTDGALRAEGSEWEMDGFTCRMIADGAISEKPPSPTEKAVADKAASDK